MAKAFDRFRTQGEARKNAQRLLRQYEDTPGEPITHPQDVADIDAMVRNHPHAEGIVGPGVRHHCVLPDAQSSRGFRTIRVDGTDDAWSYKTAITGRYPSNKTRVLGVLRWEVREDLDEARREWLRGPGAFVADTDMREAHHGKPWPFNRIIKHFLYDEFLDNFEQVGFEKLVIDGDERVGVYVLADRKFAARWREFHKARANIKFIAKSTHSRISGKNTSYRATLEDDDDFEGVTESD
ncbi:MAG: DUF3223 domain-containing protein [Dehalococcoidia bacterium]